MAECHLQWAITEFKLFAPRRSVELAILRISWDLGKELGQARLIRAQTKNLNVIDEILLVPKKDDSTLSLLLNPSSLDNITISKLRFLVCALIKRACPNSFPKIPWYPQVSQFYTSPGGKQLNSVIAHCKWHSAKAFIKHYLLDSLKPNQFLLVLWGPKL